MNQAMKRRFSKSLAAALIAASFAFGGMAAAQTNTPTPSAPQAAPAKPDTAATPAVGTPPNESTAKPDAAPANPATPAPAAPASKEAPKDASKDTPKDTSKEIPKATPEGVPLAPGGKKQTNEIEPNASPTTPEQATTENVEVPARPLVAISGQSSYDDAFKSIKGSIETVRKAMDKAGVKPTGHPITVFSAPDDKGFKYQAGMPVAEPSKAAFGDGVVAAMSPAGKAIKFQHRGAYDDIDSTYDVITAFLDAKGLQVDSPYIEEYLTDLTTADDPNLQVDIYVFVK